MNNYNLGFILFLVIWGRIGHTQPTEIEDLQAQFEIKSLSEATYTFHKKWKVYSQTYSEDSQVILSYGSFESIKKLELKIYDSHGRWLKTIKKRGFHDISADRGFEVQGARYLYYEYESGQYPITMALSYLKEFESLLFLPSFIPCPSGSVLKKASLSVVAPSDYTLRYKQNLIGDPEIENMDGQIQYQWHLESFDCPDNDAAYASYDWSSFPYVKLAPSEFETEDVKGNLSTWQGLGDWAWKLKAGRDQLSPETVTYLQNHFGNIEDTLERIKGVYEWMQGKTRYVSVQLGLGGWQPMSALEVDQLGYGDCKALVNYTQAALNVVGIYSDYTLINASRYDIDTRFPNQAFNHVVLSVLLQKDTVWLECTSQRTPAGYISNLLRNKHALIIKNGKSQLVQTPDNAGGKGLLTNHIKVQLLTDGAGSLKIHSLASGYDYEFFEGLPYIPNKKQKEFFTGFIDLPSATIDSFKINEHSCATPSLETNLSAYGQGIYTTVLNSVAFSPAFLHPLLPSLPSDHHRVSNIDFNFDHHQIDSVVVAMPPGFEMEFLPEDHSDSSKYGAYSIYYKVKGNSIYCIADRVVYKGTYPPEEYEAIRKFTEVLLTAFDQKVLLKPHLD